MKYLFYILLLLGNATYCVAQYTIDTSHIKDMTVYRIEGFLHQNNPRQSQHRFDSLLQTLNIQTLDTLKENERIYHFKPTFISSSLWIDRCIDSENELDSFFTKYAAYRYTGTSEQRNSAILQSKKNLNINFNTNKLLFLNENKLIYIQNYNHVYSNSSTLFVIKDKIELQNQYMLFERPCKGIFKINKNISKIFILENEN
jgi:hypothetical protein